jgi:hypothetical protein
LARNGCCRFHARNRNGGCSPPSRCIKANRPGRKKTPRPQRERPPRALGLPQQRRRQAYGAPRETRRLRPARRRKTGRPGSRRQIYGCPR